MTLLCYRNQVTFNIVHYSVALRLLFCETSITKNCEYGKRKSCIFAKLFTNETGHAVVCLQCLKTLHQFETI